MRGSVIYPAHLCMRLGYLLIFGRQTECLSFIVIGSTDPMIIKRQVEYLFFIIVNSADLTIIKR